MNVVRAARQIEADLRAAGTQERAANEKRYLKTEIEHLGATLPNCRRVAKAFVRTHRELSHDELTALVEALWATEIFECRMVAVLLLEAYTASLEPRDVPLINRLVRTSHTWALVDPLAANVLGTLVTRVPETARQLDRWAQDEDFWVRRAALLTTLNTGDFGRFGRYADAMLEEREFFIRKAIGWVLRERSKRDPDGVFEWLAPRIGRASGVTLREAVKYLKPAQRDELLKRRRRRKGASERT